MNRLGLTDADIAVIERWLNDGGAERLATYPTLGGPDLVFLQVHPARLRGDLDHARKPVHNALTEQPGNTDFATFATELGTSGYDFQTTSGKSSLL